MQHMWTAGSLCTTTRSDLFTSSFCKCMSQHIASVCMPVAAVVELSATGFQNNVTKVRSKPPMACIPYVSREHQLPSLSLSLSSVVCAVLLILIQTAKGIRPAAARQMVGSDLLVQVS